MQLIHIVSPILYGTFVHILKKIPPCPDNYFMKLARYHHNIGLSILSLYMMILITIGNYQTNKFYPINNLLCNSYNHNTFAYKGAELFLWSKYIEWGDTLFLHLSGKSISMLQYTHHMTTAFLMYMNMFQYLSPHIFVFMASNCFVHIFMYWYFAYPQGFLKKYRKLITSSQIVQHIVCLITIIYTSKINNCEQNIFGNFFGFIMYMMYLFYFSLFYFKSYNI